MAKSVKLTSHDINVLSVIAQKARLPHEYLLELAKSSSISSDAVLVVKSMLKYPAEQALTSGSVIKKRKVAKTSSTSNQLAKRAAEKKSAARKVASDFRRWATSMK